MWKVGGTNIKRTRARYIFYCVCTEIGEKVIFWVKHSVPENFQQENFSGLLPTEYLRTQDSENVVGLGDRAYVLKLQLLKVRSKAKTRKCYKKSEVWRKTNTFVFLVWSLWNE